MYLWSIHSSICYSCRFIHAGERKHHQAFHPLAFLFKGTVYSFETYLFCIGCSEKTGYITKTIEGNLQWTTTSLEWLPHSQHLCIWGDFPVFFLSKVLAYTKESKFFPLCIEEAWMHVKHEFSMNDSETINCIILNQMLYFIWHIFWKLNDKNLQPGSSQTTTCSSAAACGEQQHCGRVVFYCY